MSADQQAVAQQQLYQQQQQLLINNMQQQQQQQQQSTPDLNELSALASPLIPPPAAPVLEIRCLLDNGAVGGIIGKGGNSVRLVREESQAFVSIVKADFRHVQERIMVLKGTVEQIATATRGIALLLIDTASRREERPVDTAQLRLLVHKSAVGAIIGKLGQTIKDIQAETGARVQVSNETLPSSSEKTVTLTGNAQQMFAVMLRIATQLQQNPLKVGTKIYPYVPGNQAFATPYGAPVGFPQSNQPNGLHMFSSHSNPTGLSQQTQFGLIRPGVHPTSSAPAAMMSTQKIAIPTICCGSIIGKGGSVIRSLREQSQTNISISDPDEQTPNERVVTLSGTPQSISHAVFLIRQLVEAYQPNQQAHPTIQQQHQQQY